MFSFREEPPLAANAPFNISQYEYAFDMAADIEPTQIADNYGIDFDMMDCDGGSDFDELTQGNLHISFIQ